MPQNFFERAVAAAKISVEAFKEEFKQSDADANCHATGGVQPLLANLLCTIPDNNLPEILAVLIEHNVDLKVDSCDRSWLTLALDTDYQQGPKIKAAIFLAEHKAGIIQRHLPELLISIYTGLANNKNNTEAEYLTFYKILLEHYNLKIDEYPSDAYPFYEATSLCNAAYLGHLGLLQFSLSQGVNILSVSPESDRTALSYAYERSLHSEKIVDRQNADTCVNTLLNALGEYLYQQACRFIGSEADLLIELNNIVEQQVHIKPGYTEYYEIYYPPLESIKERALVPALQRYNKYCEIKKLCPELDAYIDSHKTTNKNDEARAEIAQGVLDVCKGVNHWRFRNGLSSD